MVETYDPERYNINASVAENLLFGTPIGPVFEFEALADNAYVLSVLDKLGLTEELIEIGREIAATMTEMFADLPPDHEFFEQFSFISAGDLPGFAAILSAMEGGGVKGLRPEQRQKLLSLPFKLIAARHRLDVLDERMQQRILEARQVFRRRPAGGHARPDRVLRPRALQRRGIAAGQHPGRQGRLWRGRRGGADAGSAGRGARGAGAALCRRRCRARLSGRHRRIRLSLAQRQRSAIARALLKRPDLLILNEATSALDGQAQATVSAGVRQDMAGRGLIWVLHRASLARDFERVLVMSGGKLAEQGRFAELDRKDLLTGLLIAAE